jgi:hypothetical protein
MTQVIEDLDLPGGARPAVVVRIQLAGEGGQPVHGFHGPDETIVGERFLTRRNLGLDVTGIWTADLVPNADITPAGTVYKISRRTADGNRYDDLISVPESESTLNVSDLLTDPPGALESSALAAHMADSVAHGGGGDETDPVALAAIATHEAVTVQGGAHGGPLTALTVGADPEGTAQVVADALVDHEDDLAAHGDALAVAMATADDLAAHDGDHRVHAPLTRTWHQATGWDAFTEVPISNPTGTIDLAVAANGIGTATSANENGNDRRLYMLNGFGPYQNVETRLSFSANSSSIQTALAMRASASQSVVACWTNVIFGANASLLQGVWEYNGTDLLSTNQHANSLNSITQEIIGAVGDGTMVTVRCRMPHLFTSGGQSIRVTFGPYSDTSVTATSVDATTFTLPLADVFIATSGTWRRGSTGLASGTRRHVAARVIGNQVTYKHWFDAEPEPSWTDSLRALTNVMPATLVHSGGPPPATGGVGFHVNHVGFNGRVLSFDNFSARGLP